MFKDATLDKMLGAHRTLVAYVVYNGGSPRKLKSHRKDHMKPTKITKHDIQAWTP